MQYNIIYDDQTGSEDKYTAEVYENDFERRVGIRENGNIKCYVLDEKGKLTITLGKEKSLELSYEEAQSILMGLMVEAYDVGVEMEIESV